MPETPLEKLRKSNDDYHEAVDDILKNDVPAELKTKFGAFAHDVFEAMKRAEEVIAPHYEE